jgi:hypothetical protein
MSSEASVEIINVDKRGSAGDILGLDKWSPSYAMPLNYLDKRASTGAMRRFFRIAALQSVPIDDHTAKRRAGTRHNDRQNGYRQGPQQVLIH